MKKPGLSRFFACTGLILAFFSSNSQESPPLGLHFNDAAYQRLQKKQRVRTRDYKTLAPSVSLKQFAPTPGYQTGSVCVDWSLSYAARTIMDAKEHGWTDQQKINESAYGPGFIYQLAKRPDDNDCQFGLEFDAALLVIREQGVPKFKDIREAGGCLSTAPPELVSKASQGKIRDFNRLFDSDEPNERKIEETKRALSEGNPVVIGMSVSSSFVNSKGVALWEPSSDELPLGGHAVCVVGYDQDKFGGAFEIMNSWGTDWGTGGFIWIRQKDFAQWVRYGAELLSPLPETPLFSGKFKLILENGEEIKIAKSRGIIVSPGAPVSYSAVQNVHTGDRYRVEFSNDADAYVYALTTDVTKNVSILFPTGPDVSPSIGKGTAILPSQDQFYEFDHNTGKDYFCILYSKEKMDIDRIRQTVEQDQTGSFEDKIKRALKGKLNGNPNAFKMSEEDLKFESKDAQPVVFVVQLNHVK